jgi:hypothetical protein
MTIGLTSSMIRTADRRSAQKRFADRAWAFLFGAVTGAALILFFVAP